MRKVIFLAAVLLAVAAIALIKLYPQSLNSHVTKVVEESLDGKESALLDMTAAVDFNWDKAVIFSMGSSNSEITNALGFEYTESVDLSCGILFAESGRLVGELCFPYSEKPRKLNLITSDGCKTIYPKSAMLRVEKNTTGDEEYYTVIAN